MIEGLRLLPWFQEAARRDPDGMRCLTSCPTCMASNDPVIRQAMGCGYEARTESAAPWEPPRGGRLYRGPAPTMCPGYTTSLPEVTEAALARAHWARGAVVAFCGGETPTEDLLNEILILEGSSNEVQGAVMTPVDSGGWGT